MYIPSQDIWSQFHPADGGIWIDKDSDGCFPYIAKASSDTLKNILAGCSCKLIIGIVRISGQVIRCIGLQICDDDTSPLSMVRLLWDRSEQKNLELSLAEAEVQMHLFDELSRCVCSMNCKLDRASSERGLNLIVGSNPHYSGTDPQLNEAALDIFLRAIDGKGHEDELDSIEVVVIPLELGVHRVESINAITFDESGDYRIDSKEENAEGSGLEQSVHQLLDEFFNDRLYRHPVVGTGRDRVELCDVLGVCESGVIAIQAKVRAVFGGIPKPSVERRARKISKAAKSGLSQAFGAARKIISGNQIFRSNGELIPISPDMSRRIYAVVIVSDLLIQMDWNGIIAYMEQIGKQTGASFNVFTLLELRKIVGCSNGPEVMFANLERRFQHVRSLGHGCVSWRLPNAR